MVLTPHTLKVRDLSERDTYKDLLRVHHQQRDRLPNGSIVRVKIDGEPRYYILAMRGCLDKDKDTIALDHLTREHMRVNLDEVHNFTFEKASLWNKLDWARNSADPAARIATWIAIMSGIIGVAGLILGFVGVWK